jgi:hypothetical protein
MTDFGETWALVLELWPQWKPTRVQVQEWRERLGLREQGMVQSAVRDHFSLDQSKDSGFSPRLSRVLERVRAMLESGESLPSHGGSSRWRAAWQERIHGQTVRFASAETYPSAMAVRDRYGQGVSCLRVGEDRTPWDAREVEGDESVMRRGLLLLSDFDCGRVCAASVSMPLGLRADSLRRPVSEWSRFEVGAVHAVAERLGVL